MLERHPRREITLDQQHALRAAASNLRQQFAGTFGVETILEYLYASYDEFADRAVTVAWLPLLAERFARLRLKALARIEGRWQHQVPLVVFLCTHNAGRSQMAMGWLNELAAGQAVAWSGGSAPVGQLNPAAVQAMAEVGIDISNEYPKPWTDEIMRAADVVVTMGCGDSCPVIPGLRYEDWHLDDPDGKPLEQVRAIRDEIGHRVRQLLGELATPTA